MRYLVGGRYALRHQSVGNGGEGERGDLLDLAAAPERLHQRGVDVGKACVFQQPCQPAADERVGAALLRRDDVEFGMAVEGWVGRVAEFAVIVDVLDDK